MPVPIAAMNEDCLAFAHEDHVRLSGKILRVKSVTIPHAMNHLAHQEFRLGVLIPDQTHSLTALGWGQRIHTRYHGQFFQIAQYIVAAADNMDKF